MNIQQLSYFSTAVDTSSFKETAQTHFVTPAAISKALGDLETELGIKLFVKEGRAIVPTEKALLLKPLADNISRNVKEFERLAKLPKEKHLSLQQPMPQQEANLSTEKEWRR